MTQETLNDNLTLFPDIPTDGLEWGASDGSTLLREGEGPQHALRELYGLHLFHHVLKKKTSLHMYSLLRPLHTNAQA